MRILVDIGHPGHVNFYKHVIWQLQESGHEVFVSARDKDVTLSLLDHYKIPYRTLSSIGSGSWGLVKEFLWREWGLSRLIREINPDIVTAIGGLFIAPVCKLLGKPSIVFTDSEPVPLDQVLTYPLATAICTPDCFAKDLGKNHIRYRGYHELAYLHPQYFKPDPTVLDELGVLPDEPYIVLRFVAWKATHDVGQHGFTLEWKKEIVENLSQYGRVFITSEEPLHQSLEKYRIVIAPHRIHHVLHYAHLFIGDGATMATEAGLLGTPAVRSSSLALDMGNFVELMDKYHLVYSYYSPDKAIEKAIQLLRDGQETKTSWADRQQRLLADKIDVADWMVEFIEEFV